MRRKSSKFASKRGRARRIDSTVVTKLEVPNETYVQYLRRVGDDHAQSEMIYTAQDYHTAALYIEKLIELVIAANAFVGVTHSIWCQDAKRLLKELGEERS